MKIGNSKAAVTVPLVKDNETKQRKTQARRKTASGSTELAVVALTDITAFADLIKFHGGWENFGECHRELADFITRPQVDEVSINKFKFTGDELEYGLRRLVLMPRGHLKSTVGTVLYTLWRIYRNPEIRALVACNLQSLAHSFIRELRSYLENPELESIWNNRPHIFGSLLPALDKRNRTRNTNLDTEAEDKKVIWNNNALQVNRSGRYKEPTVFATSAGTTITGMHFDLIILDDLIDFRNIESETKKEKIEEWIADVESVINPPRITEVVGIGGLILHDILGGEVLINGTRYAVDDYYAKVLEKQKDLGYQCHVRTLYKDESKPESGYLWHERYNDRIVQALQARLSPRRFASQYLNKVYEKDHALFATECIQILPNDAVYTHAGKLHCLLPNGRLEQVQPIIAVDPAFSTGKSGDDCAILSGFKLNDGSLVVADLVLDRLTAAEVVANVQRFARKYCTQRVFSEQNGVGMLLGSLFESKESYIDGKPLIVYGHYEQRVKESKIQGVLELPIASGRFYMLQQVRDNERAWKQLCNYPAVTHDDYLDGLVTLYEKTIPSRTSVDYASRYKGIAIDGVPLAITEKLQQMSEGYLSEFNVNYQ